MRRITITIGTALVVLIAASAAYAALNTYTAALSFSPTRAGSPRSPVAVAYTETLGAGNATSGSRAAPLIDIKTTIYGLVVNQRPFPTCSGPQMSVMKGDSFCPRKALVATGPVNSLLGGTDLSKSGTPCNPFLHVWNAGRGKLWFFFTTGGKYQCAGLTTGQTAAYPGYIRQQGRNLVEDVPLPKDVSTEVANQPGLYGSLIKEVLTFSKLTTQVRGKTVAFTSSIGCTGGRRPWKVAYTAFASGTTETRTVRGSSSCTR